jgi:hypothetical protein
MSNKSRYPGKGKRPPKHRYLDKLAALHRLGAFKPGTVTRTEIYHDGWCPRLSGGVCSCDADVRIKLQHARSTN